jgi:hypothetical protein
VSRRSVLLSGTLALAAICLLSYPLVAVSKAVGPVTGKISGVFHRDCLACGDSAKYIVATNVWCGWRDGDVLIHVRFSNRSVEGLKVTWHPSYAIRNGSDHGDGLTSLQETKLNGGTSINVVVRQNPKDTPTGAAIAVCKPSFFLVGH